MGEVVVVNMRIWASFPDGTRDSIVVPIGGVPRVGEYVTAKGRPQLFAVSAVHYEVGEQFEHFKVLLMLEPVRMSPDLRLVPPV